MGVLKVSSIDVYNSKLKVMDLILQICSSFNLHHFMANRRRNTGNSDRLYIWGGGPPKSLLMVIAAMKLKDTYSLEGKL